MGDLLDRLRRGLVKAPGWRDLAELGLAGVALTVLVGPAGLTTGLLHWAPRPLQLGPALGIIVVPALGEELMFRGPWIPDRTEPASPWPAILATTAAFCLWHVLETAWLPKAAPLFLRPDFPAWTVLLGLTCAILRRRSGSLWPPVILHWAAVLAWETWLGGPSGIQALR